MRRMCSQRVRATMTAPQVHPRQRGWPWRDRVPPPDRPQPFQSCLDAARRSKQRRSRNREIAPHAGAQTTPVRRPSGGRAGNRERNARRMHAAERAGGAAAHADRLRERAVAVGTRPGRSAALTAALTRRSATVLRRRCDLRQCGKRVGVSRG